MDKNNNDRNTEAQNKKSATPQDDEAVKSTKASHDTYGSGYENKRNDYRSQLGQDSSAQDASSHATAEGNTHRSGQHDAFSNDNEKDKDSYQEKEKGKGKK